MLTWRPTRLVQGVHSSCQTPRPMQMFWSAGGADEETSSPASGFSLALTSYDGRRRIVSINPDSVAGCRSRDVDAWDRNPPWLLSIPCAS
ncbi:hypothetical protein PGT21_033426 [Puccinia graminis f. sp. tritici]|uniref:Uncharacterized protein n=1 Tax=Puccinia graminis f. sp. tritici TaxID=56615 RepID=A0A5B0QJT5_PUCGR|nr:hypothetical protein PGT21_033426 [Puccinia graminis f. sp. tritici]